MSDRDLLGQSPPAAGRPGLPRGATDNDRTMAALAHASILLNYIPGLQAWAGLLVAAAIWLVHRDRSRYVTAQASQAFVFQVLWTGLAIIGLPIVLSLFGLGIGLLKLLVGLCILPIALVLLLGLAVLLIGMPLYGLYAAYETYQGRDFHYPWVGDFVRQRPIFG